MFENHLNAIKEGIKPFVNVGADCLFLNLILTSAVKLILGQALLENNSQLDIEKYPAAYLTCANVERKDMPWYKKKLAAPTVPKMLRSDDMDDEYDYEDGV